MVTRIAVYATLLLTGCASTPNELRTRPVPGVILHVQNHNWSDAVIYVVRSGARMRVGDVTANGEKSMSVPYLFTNSGTLQLYVRFIGSGATLVTPPIPVVRGQHVEVVLENYVPLSTVFPLAVIETNKVV